MTPRVGVVAVGRNEAPRLGRCLRSARTACEAVVYVDSGSSDGSPHVAAASGVHVVELDGSRPFTAARARNAGLEALVQEWPDVDRVQFVDADCELAPGWIEVACKHLDENPMTAVVAGRRREEAPEASIYNLLADMEWDTPVGETDACGGDLMARRRILAEVGGYDPTLIAGEDPEFCFRVRAAGGRIVRLDQDMTWHDSGIFSFGQWWQRQVRAGHAFAAVAARHGRPPEWFRVRPLLSIIAWSALVPALAFGAGPASGGWSLGFLAGYPILWARIRRARVRRGDPPAAARLYATACLVGKFAGLQGVIAYAWNRWVRRRPTSLIEYKGSDQG